MLPDEPESKGTTQESDGDNQTGQNWGLKAPSEAEGPSTMEIDEEDEDEEMDDEKMRGRMEARLKPGHRHHMFSQRRSRATHSKMLPALKRAETPSRPCTEGYFVNCSSST